MVKVIWCIYHPADWEVGWRGNIFWGGCFSKEEMAGGGLGRLRAGISNMKGRAGYLFKYEMADGLRTGRWAGPWSWEQRGVCAGGGRGIDGGAFKVVAMELYHQGKVV